MTGDRLTPGDPLGDAPTAPPAGSSYGGGRVPPGAFAPRDRGEVVNPFAGAQPAEWWRRAVAAIIDGLVVGLAAALVFAVLGAIVFGAFNVDEPGGATGAILTGLFVLFGVSLAALLYAPAIMARTNGKTVGKMAAGCRVVRGDGRPVDFLWAAYREVIMKSIVLGVAAALTGGLAYLVNFLWPFVDKKNRALHDIVVDSLVVLD